MTIYFGNIQHHLVFDDSINFLRGFSVFSQIIDELALRCFVEKEKDFIRVFLLEVVLYDTRIRVKVKFVKFVLRICTNVEIVIVARILLGLKDHILSHS